MKVFIVLCALTAVALAQLQPEEKTKPYSFNYVAEGDDGASSHEESSDASGAVRGSYSLRDADGRNRVVEYVADAAGFRASVRTNEPGTSNAAPADVFFESSAAAAESVVPKPLAREPAAVRFVEVPEN